MARGVGNSEYSRRYRWVRAFGLKWAKAERERLRERLTDYIIGWISGYAARRASFLRNQDDHLGIFNFI